MLLAQYNPSTFALVELITSIARLKEIFPLSWTNPVLQEHLLYNGVPVAIVTEVAPPAVDVFQTRSMTAERQPDTSWLQVWTVDEMPLPAAKEYMRNYARNILNEPSNLESVSTAEVMAFQEVRLSVVEQALGGTPAGSRYPIVAAIAADRSITLLQARTVVSDYLDLYSAQAETFMPKFFTAIDGIQAAADLDDLRAIKAALDAL